MSAGQHGRIKLGVSACLLGEKVRYDGGHKRMPYLADELAQYFDWLPICPEVAIGLGAPREPIRLVAGSGGIRALGVRTTANDVTEALARYGRDMAQQCGDISGYIFKKNSPSCGLFRVKVYDGNGMPSSAGRGIYAGAFADAHPLLPMEEEGRLHDIDLRENFVERVLVFHRWQQLIRQGITPARLVDFHAAHKYMILARGQDAYRALGRLVARAGVGEIGEVAQAYIHLLMPALAKPASRGGHANVLMHMMGYLKRHLTAEDKGEFLDLISAYRSGRMPIAVPITLLRHHLRRTPNAYLARQHYLHHHVTTSAPVLRRKPLRK